MAALPEPDLTDPDNPEWTEADFARAMRPGDPGFPEALYEAFPRTRRPRGPQKAPTKLAVKLRLDPDVVAHFREGGPGWQSRINEALRRLIVQG